MADGAGNTGTAGRVNQPPALIRAAQVAREAEVRQSTNGVRFATFGETGVTGPDLASILEAVPTAITAALKANTYYFVPLALRELPADGKAADGKPALAKGAGNDPAMIAGDYTDEYSDAAICHRNVDLDTILGSGQRGVFISTRLMGDRFALSFEFFINVAHAFVDETGIPERFAELAWQQAVANVKGETSMDAWESRHLALGRPPQMEPEAATGSGKRKRTFAATARPFGLTAAPSLAAQPLVADEKEKNLFIESAYSDAVAIYLLSLALDIDYSELREREYPLLAPGALAARLKLVAELFPPNPGYEFAVRYKRRA